MNKEEIIKKTEEFVKDKMVSVGVDVHGYRHVDRVRKWALRINAQEKLVDDHLLEMGVLLHDVGYAEQLATRNPHYEAGERISREYLNELGYHTQEDIDRICLAPLYHGQGYDDDLVRLVQDADKLDLWGAAAVARAFSHYHDKPFYINERSFYLPYEERNEVKGMRYEDRPWEQSAVDDLCHNISLINDLNTQAAKEFAKEKVEFLRLFIDQLKKETIDL